MPDTPTPGQLAYAAYCRVVYGVHVRDDDYVLYWQQRTKLPTVTLSRGYPAHHC